MNLTLPFFPESYQNIISNFLPSFSLVPSTSVFPDTDNKWHHHVVYDLVTISLHIQSTFLVRMDSELSYSLVFFRLYVNMRGIFCNLGARRNQWTTQ